MGLYVYGALLMALSFSVGVLEGSGSLAAGAVLACASAALAEVLSDVASSQWGSGVAWLADAQRAAAVTSWLLTAAAGIGAFLISMEGF